MHKQPSIPAAPPHLSKEAATWWRTINVAWPLADAALLVLQTALENFDRMRQAQALIDKDGLVITDRNGLKSHPAVRIEQNSRSAMLRALKQLNVDIEPLHEAAGRPVGFHANQSH